jgi:hypothetical protein
VATAGVASAYAMRAQGWGTAEVASLRAIQRQQRQSGWPIDRIEGPHARRWEFTLRLLEGSAEPPPGRSNGCLLVRPDTLGLPYTAPVRGTCRREAAGSRDPEQEYPL